MRCAACGQENPDGFKFCGNCAAPLGVAEPPREVRKTVTIVFCDLSGSTALGDVTDPETLRATMRGYYDEMRTILERHGGRVEKFIGDAVMAVFGVPVAHEDDALRAVRAAWEMRAAVPALGLRARIGVNTGEVVAGEGDALVTGDAVNVAARLEQAADPGDVLIGSETRGLVRDAVEVEQLQVAAKGKTDPVNAFRLMAVDPEAAAVTRRFDTPLIGREGELEQLRQAFQRTIREQRCHLFTILGPAGVGKSRLVAEFLADVNGTVLEGRCLDYGEGITYWPVISVLKQLGARGEPTVARLVEGAATANDLFWSVRAQLEEVALERPLVVCFDDVQWGEETFFDLVDHIADLSRGAPLLLLCIARPELLDKRPGWGGGKLNATAILLEPLSTEQCSELIEFRGGVGDGMADRILAAAEGNPLFVEEMVAFAHEAGDVRVPSTVQALLQARLDQLGGDERSVIERGAVEGEIFHRGAVLQLIAPAEVDAHLVRLVRKELIRPTPPQFTGDQAFRFRHLLVRDAAYDALPKETRAELHERFADWLEQHGRELIELDEILSYHLEQAARYRRELGRADETLDRRAAAHLAAAGRRAAERRDGPAAANLLGRAIELLPTDDPARASAFLDRVYLLLSTDRISELLAMIEELEQSDDADTRLHGHLARLQHQLWTDPTTAVSEVPVATDEAIRRFEAQADHRGLAAAWQLKAQWSWMQSRAEDTLAAMEQVALHGGEAGAVELKGLEDVLRIGPLVHGPFTRDEVRAHRDRLQHDERAVIVLEAHLAEMEGRFDAALEANATIQAALNELGLAAVALAPKVAKAELLRHTGRLDESLQTWDVVIGEARALGHTSFLSTMLVGAAHTRYQLADGDGAAKLALEGEEIGAAEDFINFAWGRGVRACVAADRGEGTAAEELARSALEYAYRTDFPHARAEAHEALGYVLATAGRIDEATSEYQQALTIWETYGWIWKADRVRELLVEL